MEVMKTHEFFGQDLVAVPICRSRLLGHSTGSISLRGRRRKRSQGAQILCVFVYLKTLHLREPLVGSGWNAKTFQPTLSITWTCNSPQAPARLTRAQMQVSKEE